MNWTKTEWISVPANKNQTTEVAINEWFTQDRSFLLGTPVASQLRGTDGGWAQTCAIAAHPEQDTIALLLDRLTQILRRAKGDATPSPSTSNAHSQGDTIMATVIPADRFESNSAYSFILRENPKASGIEVQFPLDCTEYRWEANSQWTNTDRANIRDRIAQSTNGFISLIEKEGFQQANGNPFLWFTKETDAQVFQRKIAKARGWVQKCSTKGAYEIDSDTPVERTKSRRRTGTSKPQPPEPAPTATGNKLADAIAAVLLPQIVEAIGSTTSADEVQRLRDENRHLEELVKGMKSTIEETDRNYRDAMSQRDAALAKAQEMEQAALALAQEVEKFRNMAVELERDRNTLKLTLSEYGLNPDESELNSVESEVNWDESESPHSSEPIPDESVEWDDDSIEPGLNSTETCVEWEDDSKGKSDDEPEENTESEGFDLDGLGEI